MENTPTKPVKIAVSGAMCSGKTTLLQLAEEQYRDKPVAFVPEQARIFFTNRTFDDRLHPDVQAELFPLIIEAEQAAERSGAQVLVCDRSVFDAVIHAKLGGYHDGAQELMEQIRPWMDTYHHLLISDIAGIPFVNDDIRTEDAEARDRLHALIIEACNEHGIAFDMVSGSREERLARLRSLIDRYLVK